MSAFGKLYLLPVPIVGEGGYEYLPDLNASVINRLNYFIAEDAKTARRFLKGFGYKNIPEAEIFILNEHTSGGDVSALLQPLLNGQDIGLMSDAGCPGIADPGADIVKLAHKKDIEIIPLVGPSSIVLSMMSSGFNGQNFAFVGYLPIDKIQKTKRLRELEQTMLKNNQAIYFIETPYRNAQLFESLLSTLAPSTLLFIGCHLTSPSQFLKSKSIQEWKKSAVPDFHKIPAVFGIYR